MGGFLKKAAPWVIGTLLAFGFICFAFERQAEMECSRGGNLSQYCAEVLN